MIKNSLTYVNTRNQTTFSEDPFDIGLSFTQGSSMLSHERALELYAEELVSKFAKYECEEYRLDTESLPDAERAELTRLFLESIDREFETESILGGDYSINSDYNCALLAMLKDNNAETRANLASITARNIQKYYDKELQSVLIGACLGYLHYTNQEAGYQCYQDTEHGDFCWRKVK